MKEEICEIIGSDCWAIYKHNDKKIEHVYYINFRTDQPGFGEKVRMDFIADPSQLINDINNGKSISLSLYDPPEAHVPRKEQELPVNGYYYTKKDNIIVRTHVCCYGTAYD